MPIALNLDTPRLTNYERLENIYRGHHTKVFDLEHDSQFPAISIGIPAAIVDALAGLVAGRTPAIKLSTEVASKRVTETLDASGFGSELLQFVTAGLLYGDAVFKVYGTDQGIPRIRSVSPKRWHSITDPDDVDTVTAHVLTSIRKIGDTRLLLAETHEPGTIAFQVFRLEGAKLGRELPLSEAGKFVPEWAGLPPIVETGIDELLIVSWSHNRLSGDQYGTSEFRSIWDLIRSLDQRATQEDRVLSKHADPKLILKQSSVERDANGNIVIPSLDVLLLDDTSSKEQIGYLTWDARLAEVDTKIKRDIELMLSQTQTSRLLLNADNTQAQTGLAVLAQLNPSIMKAEKIQKSIEASLRQLIRVTQKLAAKQGKSFAPSPVSIEWGVKLPTDLQSLVQSELMQVQAGLKTAEEAREDLDAKKRL